MTSAQTHEFTSQIRNLSVSFLGVFLDGGGVSSVLPIAISIIVTYLLIFTLIYDGKGGGGKVPQCNCKGCRLEENE